MLEYIYILLVYNLAAHAWPYIIAYIHVGHLQQVGLLVLLCWCIYMHRLWLKPKKKLKNRTSHVEHVAIE